MQTLNQDTALVSHVLIKKRKKVHDPSFDVGLLALLMCNKARAVISAQSWVWSLARPKTKNGSYLLFATRVPQGTIDQMHRTHLKSFQIETIGTLAKFNLTCDHIGTTVLWLLANNPLPLQKERRRIVEET